MPIGMSLWIGKPFYTPFSWDFENNLSVVHSAKECGGYLERTDCNFEVITFNWSIIFNAYEFPRKIWEIVEYKLPIRLIITAEKKFTWDSGYNLIEPQIEVIP